MSSRARRGRRASRATVDRRRSGADVAAWRDIALYLTCAVLLILMLVFDPSLRNVFDLPKAVFSHGLAWLLLAVLVVIALRDGVRIPASPLFVAAYAVVAVEVAATVAAENQYVAVYGEVGRYLGLTTHLVLALVAVGIVVGAEYPRTARWLGAALLGASVVSAAYAGTQLLGLDPVRWSDLDPKSRPFATLGNPDFYGQFLSAAAVAAAAVALFWNGAGGTRMRWGIAALAAISGVLLVMTRTRGAVIGLVAGLIVLGLLWLRRRGPTKGAFVGLSLGSTAVAGALGLVVLTTPLGDRLVALTDVANIQDRVLIYSSATRIFLDHPLLGVGFENFAVAYPRYEEAEGIKNNRTQTSAHNWILHIAATTGLAGLAANGALLVAFAVHVWRRARDADATALLAAGTALTAYYGSGLVLPGAQAIQWIPWACLGVALASDVRTARVVARVPPLRVPLLGLIAILVGLSAPALFQGDVLAANRQAKVAESALRPESAQRAVDAAKAASTADPGRAVYWNDLGRALELVNDQAGARRAYVEATVRSPYTPAFWWNLGRMHVFFAQRGEPGAKTAAYEALRQALAASPQNPDTYDQLARAQFTLGDPSDALASEERAIALYPGDPRYYVVAADAARQLQETTRSLDLLRQGVAATDSNDLRITLARRLIEARSDLEARGVLNDVLRSDPTNAAALELLQQIAGR